MVDHDRCISVFDATSKKAETYADPNMSEKPVIPPECTMSQNEDFLDKHINRHALDHNRVRRESAAHVVNMAELNMTDGSASQLSQIGLQQNKTIEQDRQGRSRLHKSPLSPPREQATQGGRSDRKDQFGTDLTNCDSPLKDNGSAIMAKMGRQESIEQMGIFKNVAQIMVVSPEKKVSTTPIKR